MSGVELEKKDGVEDPIGAKYRELTGYSFYESLGEELRVMNIEGIHDVNEAFCSLLTNWVGSGHITSNDGRDLGSLWIEKHPGLSSDNIEAIIEKATGDGHGS